MQFLIDERKWPSLIFTPISIANHVITLADTRGLHPKQKITLLKAGIESKEFEIKRILTRTTLHVGPIGTSIREYSDPIEFHGGTFSLEEQERNKMGWEIVGRAVYEEAPAVALRTLLVDSYGDYIDSILGPDNRRRLCVDAAVTVVNPQFAVYITAKDDDPNPGDIHDSIRIGDGIDEMEVNSDGSINVRWTDIPFIPAVYNIPIAAANTEIFFVFPIGVKRFGMKVRGYTAKTQLGFAPGASSSNFITIDRGCSFRESLVNAGAITLYFQVDKPNQIMEIWTWA